MAATALSVLKAQVDRLIKMPNSPTVLDDATVQEGIKDAVADYSRVRPKVYTEEFAGADTYYYALGTTLSHWDDDFSQILQVEYPAADVSDDETPTVLDADHDWEIYRTSDAVYLRFITVQPTSSYNVRVVYTAPRTWSTDADPTVDIPSNHFYAVCWLAASKLLDPAGTYFARSRAVDEFSMDSVNWNTVTAEYRRQSERYLQWYKEALGLSGPTPQIVVMDTDREWPKPFGRDYIWKRRETR